MSSFHPQEDRPHCLSHQIHAQDPFRVSTLAHLLIISVYRKMHIQCLLLPKVRAHQHHSESFLHIASYLSVTAAFAIFTMVAIAVMYSPRFSPSLASRLPETDSQVCLEEAQRLLYLWPVLARLVSCLERCFEDSIDGKLFSSVPGLNV